MKGCDGRHRLLSASLGGGGDMCRVCEIGMCPPTARKAACGFTLMEILIAIGIGALAMMGVLSVFATAVRSRQRAIDGMEAAGIATSVASEARARFRRGSQLLPVKDGRWPGKHRYTYDIGYVGLDKTGDEVLMQIKVYWKERGERVALEFETILLRKME